MEWTKQLEIIRRHAQDPILVKSADSRDEILAAISAVEAKDVDETPDDLTFGLLLRAASGSVDGSLLISEILSLLAQRHVSVRDRILEMIRKGNVHARWAAINSIPVGLSSPPEFAETILRLALRDSDHRLRMGAASMVQTLGLKSLLPDLKELQQIVEPDSSEGCALAQYVEMLRDGYSVQQYADGLATKGFGDGRPTCQLTVRLRDGRWIGGDVLDEDLQLRGAAVIAAEWRVRWEQERRTSVT